MRVKAQALLKLLLAQKLARMKLQPQLLGAEARLVLPPQKLTRL